MVLHLAMIITAVVAAWSWLDAARAGRPFARQESQLLAGCAVAHLAARAVEATGWSAAYAVAGALLLTGSLLGLVAVATVVRRVSGTAGGPSFLLVEASLVAAAVGCLAWVLAGPPTAPSVQQLLQAAPAMVDAAVIAVLLRLIAMVPETVTVDGNRSALLICAGAVLLVGGADWIAAWHVVVGDGQVGVAQHVVAVAGYTLMAVVPRIPTVQSATSAPTPRVRALPYVMAAAALLAVGGGEALGQIGPVPVVLCGVVVGCLIALQALTLREHAALVAGLTWSRTRLTALVENSSDLIVRLDTNGRVQAANDAALWLLHRTPLSLTGRSFDDLASAQDRRTVREAVLEVTRGRRDAAQVELRLAPPATGTAQLRLRAVPGGAVANLNDVTESVELRQRLERLARYDQMTGLVNRSHLLDVLGAWVGDPEADVVVLFADLDGFKAVNDRFGHGAGDRVLSEVAGRFDSLAAALDARRAVVGRFGGDEFVMALEGLGPDEALAAAHKVVEAISPSFTIDDRTVTLGVSVGVAGAGPQHDQQVGSGRLGDADPAAELVHQADLAMYQAKRGGRSSTAAGVGCWTPAVEERARRRVDIAIGLRDALDTGSLAVAYQPIVRLVDGVVVGAEALLRLPPGVGLAGLTGELPAAENGPDDLVSPAELVAVAEDTGIIAEMGEWVLTQAVQQAAEWAAAGLTASVSVNMSVHQLVSRGFVDSVRKVLGACGLEASRLVLELTESQLVGPAGPAVQALEQLRADGVRVALDDFGTGYSSLSYLRRMPVQLVKLDRALLDDVGIDPRATALARSVVAMARELGLLVVAEGMEDMESVRLLRELGAYAAQGFALSPALPPEAMLGVLTGPAMDLGEGRAHPPQPAGDVHLDLPGQARSEAGPEAAPVAVTQLGVPVDISSH